MNPTCSEALTETPLEIKNEKVKSEVKSQVNISLSQEEPQAPSPSTFPLCRVHLLSVREFKVEAASIYCHRCPEQSDASVGDRMFRCPDQSCTFVLCLRCARPRFKYAEGKDHSEDFSCSICLEMLWEPAQHNKCGHSFCLSCLEGWSALHGNCPMCKDSIDPKNAASVSRVALRSVLSYLDKIEVNCSICDKAFERGRLLHHELQVCSTACLQGCATASLPLAQQASHFALACPMTALPCRQGCGLRVRRSAMEAHVASMCPVPVACPEGCPAQVPRFQFAQHAAGCPNVRVACSRGCSALVSRGALAGHLEQQCPAPLACPRRCGVELAEKDFEAHGAACSEMPATCEGKEFLCAFAGPRRLVAEHMRVCTAVAVLPGLRSLRETMSRVTETLAAEIKRQDHEIKRLDSDNKRQDTEIKRLDSDNKRLDSDNKRQDTEIKQLKKLLEPVVHYAALTGTSGSAISVDPVSSGARVDSFELLSPPALADTMTLHPTTGRVRGSLPEVKQATLLELRVLAKNLAAQCGVSATLAVTVQPKPKVRVRQRATISFAHFFRVGLPYRERVSVGAICRLSFNNFHLRYEIAGCFSCQHGRTRRVVRPRGRRPPSRRVL